MDRAIAARLGPGAAFLPLDGGWGAVRGSVLDLVLAVGERCPGRAHAALRQRIRTTSTPTGLDRDVVAVAAKRVAAVSPAEGMAPDVEDLAPWRVRAQERARAAAFDPGVARAPADGRAFVEALVPAGDDRPLAERDRPVVAVLVGADGRIRWAARNAGGRNRALHAEVCLVLGHVEAHGPLPVGSTLLVSLEPCRMCAALIVAHAAGPLAVRFTTPDPGPLARDTALGAAGWLARLDLPAPPGRIPNRR